MTYFVTTTKECVPGFSSSNKEDNEKNRTHYYNTKEAYQVIHLITLNTRLHSTHRVYTGVSFVKPDLTGAPFIYLYMSIIEF